MYACARARVSCWYSGVERLEVAVAARVGLPDRWEFTHPYQMSEGEMLNEQKTSAFILAGYADGFVVVLDTDSIR